MTAFKGKTIFLLSGDKNILKSLLRLPAFLNLNVLLIFIIFCSCLIYCLIRSAILAFTWDESFTFLNFVNHKEWFFLYDGTSANNHYLNTWLMKLMLFTFGNNEFFLRIPNLIAYLLYGYFSAKIVTKTNDCIIAPAGFFVLNVSVYLLDFFSLARGYGISLGLMMGGLYHLSEFIKENKVNNAICTAIFNSIALLANFSTLYLFIPALSIILIEIVINFDNFMLLNYRQKGHNILFLSIYFICNVFVLWLSYIYGKGLQDAGAFFYGGESGILIDTLESLIDRFFYSFNTHGVLISFFEIFITIIIGIYIVLLLRFIFRNPVIPMTTNRETNYLFLLITCVFCLMIMNNYFFKTKFLVGRTAIFVFPLFFYFIIRLSAGINKIAGRAIMICIALISGTIFFVKANFSYFLEWKGDSNSRHIAEYFNHEHDIKPGDTFFLGIFNGHCESPLLYYQEKLQMDYLTIKDVADTVQMTYGNKYQVLPFLQSVTIPSDTFNIVKYYPLSETFLIKLHEPSKNIRNLIPLKISFDSVPENSIYFTRLATLQKFSGNYSLKVNSSFPFSYSFELEIPDSILSYDIVAIFKSKVYSEEINNQTMMVISFERDGIPVIWKNYNFMDLHCIPERWNSILFGVPMPKDSKSGDIIKAHIWNSGAYNVYADDMEFLLAKIL